MIMVSVAIALMLEPNLRVGASLSIVAPLGVAIMTKVPAFFSMMRDYQAIDLGAVRRPHDDAFFSRYQTAVSLLKSLYVVFLHDIAANPKTTMAKRK